jgi:ESCRT-II complex subunit VPS22
MMRGGMGLGKVHVDRQMKENYAKMGQQIEKESIEKLKTQVEDFSKNLEAFSMKYKDEIKYNPDFRQKFYMMCKEIGVDPIASTSLWNKNLNLAEFYYNLAVSMDSYNL